MSIDTKDSARGLYEKFRVYRKDGRDLPGEKHENCDYFVLDLTHDPFTLPALRAYAHACAEDYPELSRDLHSKCDSIEREQRWTLRPESAASRLNGIGKAIEDAVTARREDAAGAGHHAPHAKRYAVRDGSLEEHPFGMLVDFDDYEALRRQYDATADGYRAALSTAEAELKRVTEIAQRRGREMPLCSGLSHDHARPHPGVP